MIEWRFTAPPFPAPLRRAVFGSASRIHFRDLTGSGLALEAVAVDLLSQKGEIKNKNFALNRKLL